MIHFFKRIRQVLLSQNRLRRYFIYAIGEIVLVVVGILIALSINNWNEQRKAQNDFEFGLKQVYTQLNVNYFDLLSSKERITFQLTYIDSLQNYQELLNPGSIPGIIQLQDYLGLSSDINQRQLFEPYLRLNIDDEIQNELAKSLDGYSLNANYFKSTQLFNFEQTEIAINLFNHLKTNNIPLRFMDQAPAFREFIKAPSPDFYSEANLEAVKQLINNPSFQADLKTIQHLKEEFIRDFSEIENIYITTLDFLNKNYPSSIDYINKMEVIGSGLPNSSWAIGVPMVKMEDGVFEIEMQLISGDIKFRTDQNYTYDWGGSQTDVNQLSFKGTNIPVVQGYYKIKLDLNKQQYSILPSDK